MIPPDLILNKRNELELINELSSLGYNNFYYDENLSNKLKNTIKSLNDLMIFRLKLIKVLGDNFIDKKNIFKNETFNYYMDLYNFNKNNNFYVTKLTLTGSSSVSGLSDNIIVIEEQYIDFIIKFIDLNIFI